MINVATVCSGIGAPEKALSNLGIPFKLIFFSEIDKSAIKAYCAIHNESADKNIGNLKNFRKYKFKVSIDLLIGGTPCQDFSIAGQGAGGEQNSGTRSSLMWDYLDMIEALKPKVVIWENVAAVINNNHYNNYKKFYFKLLSLGYKIDAKYTIQNISTCRKTENAFSWLLNEKIAICHLLTLSDMTRKLD